MRSASWIAVLVSSAIGLVMFHSLMIASPPKKSAPMRFDSRQVPQQKIDALNQVALLDLRVRSSKTFSSQAADGSPGISYVAVYGTINGSENWTISCVKEDGPHGSVPCVELLAGPYRASWIHQGEMIEVFTFDARGELVRYFYDVEPSPDSISINTDPALGSPLIQINFKLPKGKRLEDYPLLLHIYASRQYSYESGYIPGSTNCADDGKFDPLFLSPGQATAQNGEWTLRKNRRSVVVGEMHRKVCFQ